MSESKARASLPDLFTHLSSPRNLPYSISALQALSAPYLFSHASNNHVDEETLINLAGLKEISRAETEFKAGHGDWIKSCPPGWPIPIFAKVFGEFPTLTVSSSSSGEAASHLKSKPWAVIVSLAIGQDPPDSFYSFFSTEPWLLRSGRWKLRDGLLADLKMSEDGGNETTKMKLNEGYDDEQVEEVLGSTRELFEQVTREVLSYENHVMLASVNQLHLPQLNSLTTYAIHQSHEIVMCNKTAKFVFPLNECIKLSSSPSSTTKKRTSEQQIRGNLSIARPSDLQTMIDLNGFRFRREFISPRRFLSTCFRPLVREDGEEKEKEMVAWMTFHGDLSLALLHTLPSYRSQNLASLCMSNCAELISKAWDHLLSQADVVGPELHTAVDTVPPNGNGASLGSLERTRRERIKQMTMMHGDVYVGNEDGRRFFEKRFGKESEILGSAWVRIQAT